MNCPPPPPPNYSSPVEYQYFLVVSLKWKPPRDYHYPTYPQTTNHPPPPQKKKKSKKKVKTNPRIPGENDQKKRKKKEKKEGTIFVNLPSEDSLVDEPS